MCAGRGIVCIGSCRGRCLAAGWLRRTADATAASLRQGADSSDLRLRTDGHAVLCAGMEQGAAYLAGVHRAREDLAVLAFDEGNTEPLHETAEREIAVPIQAGADFVSVLAVA